jgi:hypothetical protein
MTMDERRFWHIHKNIRGHVEGYKYIPINPTNGRKASASVVEVDSIKNDQRALTSVTEFKYPKRYRSCH